MFTGITNPRSNTLKTNAAKAFEALTTNTIEMNAIDVGLPY